jgi:putative membrane protein
MTKKQYTVTALLLVAFAGIGFAQSNSADRMRSGGVPVSDRTFMNKAAQGGMAEVEMGNLALQKGQSQAVKDFGQRMMDDHTKAGDELRTLASQKNVTLPTTLSAKDQALKDRLSKLNGAAFDRMYITHMVADHKEDVSEFQNEANNGQDPDVKAWAKKTLPTLQAHLQHAQKAQSGL